MTGSDYGMSLLAWDSPFPSSSPEQVERARITVASYSVDAEDCRNLLIMLGLMEV